MVALVAAAICTARLVIWLASPADWSEAAIFSGAAYASPLLQPLLTSPFDFVITAASAAQKAANAKERDRLLTLAKYDYESRMNKLKQTLHGIDSAYDTSRKEDLTKTGNATVARMTPQEADEKLRHFVPFTPKEFRMENRPSALEPAGARMLYDDQRH